MPKLKDTKDGYSLIPIGEYKVELSNIEKKPSGAGNDCYYWRYEILSGEHQGRILLDTTSLVESSLWKLKKMLKGLCSEEKYLELKELDVDGGHFYGEMQLLKGKQFKVSVTHREWPKGSGEMRANISNYMPAVSVDDELKGEIDDESDTDSVPF